MKYTVVTVEHEVGEPLDTTKVDPLYNSQNDAFEAACTKAEADVEYYMSDCDDDISFGIPEDSDYQAQSAVKVDCYRGDCTELVSARFVVPINV